MSGEDFIGLCKPEIVLLLLKTEAAVPENDVKLAQENKRLKDTAAIEELRKILKNDRPGVSFFRLVALNGARNMV